MEDILGKEFGEYRIELNKMYKIVMFSWEKTLSLNDEFYSYG